MFPAMRHSRALDLCVLAAVLAAWGCASGGPAPAPASLPAPVYAEPLLGTTRVEPAPPAASAVPAQPKPSSVKSDRPAAPTRTATRSAPAKPRSEPAKAAKPIGKAPAKPRAQPRVDSMALELAVTRQFAHRPLAAALERRTRQPYLAERAASAVVQEALRLRLSPSLVAAVLLIENARLDSTAVSTQGAIGMMQVMPMHAGSYGCESADLVNIDSNICHGASLLKTFLRRNSDLTLALRRYNGCVRGRNTPRCSRYPVRVLSTAARLRREILSTAATWSDPEAVSPLLASLEESSETADSLDAEGEEEVGGCSTLLGCLRNRWSMQR